MFAENVTLNVGDPTMVKFALYGFAAVVLFCGILGLKRVIWKFFPKFKATVVNFKFDGRSPYGGMLYSVDVEYEKKGMKCTKKVEYTEVIASDGRPKYLPGDIIILRENPITGTCRTEEDVKLRTASVFSNAPILIIGLALLFAAVKFHLFANENLQNTNEVEIPQSAMSTVVLAFAGVMFGVPVGMNILEAIISYIKTSKLKRDFKNGKYVPLTTVLAGYTVVRRRTNRNGHKRTTYHYYPYYKYQLGNEILTVVSDISSYEDDMTQIGKNYSCFRNIDNDKTIGYDPTELTSVGEFIVVVGLGGFLAVIIFLLSQVTF